MANSNPGGPWHDRKRDPGSSGSFHTRRHRHRLEPYHGKGHEDDFTGLVAAVIDNGDWQGIINGVSPYPVKNKDFLKALRSAYRVAFGLPQPAFILRIGASLIGTEAELILSGRRVVSKVLERKHFAFSYPRLEDALRQLITPPPFLRESEP